MTAADADTHRVFRLIYRSRSRIPAERRKAELGDLFSAARSNNKKKDVTGALLCGEDWFVQALEGDESTVRAVFDHISGDERHEDVAIVDTADGVGRVFGRWSMARVTEDGEPDIPLITNVHRGGAVPAANRATTAEQDELLEFMRSAATQGSKAT